MDGYHLLLMMKRVLLFLFLCVCSALANQWFMHKVSHSTSWSKRPAGGHRWLGCARDDTFMAEMRKQLVVLPPDTIIQCNLGVSSATDWDDGIFVCECLFFYYDVELLDYDDTMSL